MRWPFRQLVVADPQTLLPPSPPSCTHRHLFFSRMHSHSTRHTNEHKLLQVTKQISRLAPQAASRAEATKIIAETRRIVNPGGVEQLEKVQIGGIDQWVSIRGADRRNPVLLYIHGGPGYVSIPMSWWFTRGLEEYFTVVQWDQRAAGKTFLLTDPAKIASTVTTEQMIGDVEEMAGWVRREFGKDKIFVLGHSYGSFLGLQVAQRHPEWLYAYIGVCQSIN